MLSVGPLRDNPQLVSCQHISYLNTNIFNAQSIWLKRLPTIDRMDLNELQVIDKFRS